MRVDRVNQEHSDVGGPGAFEQVRILEHRDLAAGATVAFHAVRCGTDDQQFFGIGCANQRDIRGQFFAVDTPVVGKDMRLHLTPQGDGRVPKVAARPHVAVGEKS